MDLAWHCHEFEALRPAQLYDLLRLRIAVFGVEQQCVYQDLDGLDPGAQHLLGSLGLAQPRLVAYARCLSPGLKGPEASIGRVVVDADFRGCGLGHELMRRALAHCRLLYPGVAVRISAQAHLQRFYAGHGFTGIGEVYLEDGIAHRVMLRLDGATGRGTSPGQRPLPSRGETALRDREG